MAPTPFEHGLALAWSDGAYQRRSVNARKTPTVRIDTIKKELQEQLGLQKFQEMIEDPETETDSKRMVGRIERW